LLVNVGLGKPTKNDERAFFGRRVALLLNLDAQTRKTYPRSSFSSATTLQSVAVRSNIVFAAARRINQSADHG
jgi:hypothetical protein